MIKIRYLSLVIKKWSFKPWLIYSGLTWYLWLIARRAVPNMSHPALHTEQADSSNVGGSDGVVWIEPCVGEINNAPCPASRASDGWHAAADAPEPGLWMGPPNDTQIRRTWTRGYIERTTQAVGCSRRTRINENTVSFTSVFQLPSRKDLFLVTFEVLIKVVKVEYYKTEVFYKLTIFEISLFIYTKKIYCFGNK